MKLGALKQGDKFRYPGQVSGFYVKGSAIPGTFGARFHVHSDNVVYTGGGYFDEEVERIGNINEKIVMKKYIRVDWPESQEWDDKRFDNDVFRIMDFYPIVFVPDELYNKVHSRRLPPDAPRCKNCEHCVKGKHSKGQWWELLVCAKQPKGDGLFKATSKYKGKDCEMFEPRKGE